MAVEKIEHIATELTKAMIIAKPRFAANISKAIELREEFVKELEKREEKKEKPK